MDEQVENSLPDDFPPHGGDRDELDDSELSEGVAVHAGGRGWETYLRCFFLLAVVSLLGFLIWQPGLLRLNMLASLANPSRGESLAWKAEDDPSTQPMEIKRTKPPAEWRLTPGFSANWHAQRPPAKNVNTNAGGLTRVAWRRFSVNPWSWQDDVAFRHGKTGDDEAILPPQKPASSFRAGNILAFPEPDPLLSPAASAYAGLGGGSELAAPPLLPPLNRDDNNNGRPTPPAIFSAPPGTGSQPGSGDLRLPPLAPLGTDAVPARPQAATPAPTPAPPVADTAARLQPAAPVPAATQEIDWKNREITGPIPDAYLTVYPKLKFIGLCVPGQGYIRKYNQIGVPADVNNPKLRAQDGRTPYGRYYIADRNRDADGPRLYLSWPSPEDAERIGLTPQEKAAVEVAWQRQVLPPQNTTAGGGLGINGLRQWVETTEGGFTLETPHMEEIFTALPDRAWVFIQP